VVSIEMGSSCCCLIVSSCPLRCGPASPFIDSKGRARVTFAVKGRKTGKMKERQKRWPRA
jgi:hypothetical protein